MKADDSGSVSDSDWGAAWVTTSIGNTPIWGRARSGATKGMVESASGVAADSGAAAAASTAAAAARKATATVARSNESVPFARRGRVSSMKSDDPNLDHHANRLTPTPPSD